MKRSLHVRSGTALCRHGLVALALLAACEADRYPIGSELPQAPAGGSGGSMPAAAGSQGLAPPTSAAPGPAANGECQLPGAPMPVRAVAISPLVVADRLSRFLWGRPADASFLEAVTRATLATTSDVAAAASALLNDRAAVIESFYQEWLGLIPPPARIPGYTPEMTVNLLPESWELVRYLTQYGGSFADLLQVPFSFPHPSMAEIYGVAVPPDGPHRVDLDPAQRGGVLTNAAWLVAHPTASARGLWVNSILYCQGMLAPPAGDFHPPDPDPATGMTSRERLEQATAQAACHGCHQLLDPPGLLFENYDPVGRYRTLDSGRAVNARAQVRLPDFEGALENAAALAKVAAGSCEAQTCFVRHWLARATGTDRPDLAAVKEVTAAFRYSRLGLRELILAVVQSPAFLKP